MVNRKIPKIRFKHFGDGWKSDKLGNLGTVAMNKRIFKEETSEVGEVPFYKIGTFGGKPDSFITRDKFEEYKSKYPYPKIGDILISASGSIGRTVEYQGEEAYFQDSNIVWLKHDGRIDNSFLKHFYAIVKWQGVEGTTIKRLYNKNILETPITLPSISEQSAIGSLFCTLDDLLASYKDNLANYQALKVTMLSKMFPKAGQTVPEIRLDGFEGEWDLIKLGDFCDLITKGTTGKSQSEQGMVNFVKVENLKDNEIYPIVKISEEEHFGSLKRSILYEGDILFSIAGTLGRTAIVKNNILPANTNQALAIIRGYKLDAYFLLVVLSGEVVKDYIRKNPTVGAQPNLSLEQVSSLKIKIPSLDEQQAIGAYFSNLDNLIAAHQEKISQLETLKKKLLQDMFI